MIVLDTGGLYAALDANEALHGRAVAALVASAPPRTCRLSSWRSSIT